MLVPLVDLRVQSTSDDDAFYDPAFDGLVASVIQHRRADIGMVGQPLRLLKDRPILQRNRNPRATEGVATDVRQPEKLKGFMWGG